MQPLAGVKVVDFFWVMAGPAATRVLADYGATVVRVESTRRIDTARTLAPFFRQQLGPENSGCFQNLNAGKRMLTLDIAHPEGRAVALDLVRWADVVCESFSPGRMQALGLDYATLRRVKPDIVMVSSCLMGQTGPLARFAGYGNLASAIAGFSNLGGWPDRPPAGPFSAYTDYVSPRFTAAAILAALDHRRRTGEGQHLDLSQAEASLHFLGPWVLDYTVNGRLHERVGNRDPDSAPHGTYPTAGDDRWVAIAVADDAQWTALAEAMGQPALAHDPRFATAAARVAHAETLDALVAAWTAPHDRHALAALLQARGIAAYAVQNSGDCVRDPQLLHRGHFVEVSHPEHGEVTLEGSRFRLERTPAVPPAVAPTFGADNDVVLRELLGYDDARVTALVAAGVLE
ncbi:MAG: CoA transferase [Candidatus Binatia bacterium]